MGFTPAQVGEMSVWEFNAAAEGYVEAHAPSGGMSAAEQDDVWDWMQTKEDRVH